MALTSISEELRSKIGSCKVLVVGAGGIGCELLKNLVLTGFEDIEVLDLDTIDVSNLNRQFLFQRKHVGRPKAEVAKESCLQFNPNARIKVHCANVMSKECSLSYFSQFDVVMNALDNRAARTHVNRMCLNATVPLIESGTSGYAGQVELIYKGLTPGPQEQKKTTYPAFSIRTSPTKHIHCTIWAKYIFYQLFGEKADNYDEEILDIRTKGNKNNPKISPKEWAQQTDYDPEKLFNKLFYDDILYNLSMDDLWKERKPPVPLSWDKEVEDIPSTGRSTCGGMNDRKLWTIAECREKFAEALKLLKEASEQLGGENLVWDKDDEPAMNFVAAAANIRAHVYGIRLKSKFDIKGMAGNIIPAIATSNAVVAGLIVLFALKVLNSKIEECKTVYLRNCLGFRGTFIAPEKNFPMRNPNCFVCSSNQISLMTDIKKFTLRELDELVLRGKLSMVEPEVMLNEKLLISSEEGETKHIANKALFEVGVLTGSQLKVEDFVQNYEIKMIVVDAKLSEEEGEIDLQNCLGLRGAFIVLEKDFPASNPNCFVCSSNQISLLTDIKKFTLRDLDELVLRGKLSMVEPEVMLNEKLLISSEEGETKHIANKALFEVGVLTGSQLKVEDFVQNYEIKMIVVDAILSEEEGGVDLLNCLGLSGAFIVLEKNFPTRNPVVCKLSEEEGEVDLQNCLGLRGAFIVLEKDFPASNPNCFVCSSNQISLLTDIKKFTLRDLDELVLRGKLSMVEPEVMLNEKLLISSEEGEIKHTANKALSEVGVLSGSQMKVEDFVQNYETKMIVVDAKLTEDEGKFITEDLETIKNSTKECLGEKSASETNGDSSSSAGPSKPQPVSDDVDVICSNDHPSTSGDSSSSAGPSKPQPVSDDVDVICSNDHPSTPGDSSSSAGPSKPQPVSDDVDVIRSNDHPSTSGDSSSSAGPSKPQPVSDDVDVICSNDHPSTPGDSSSSAGPSKPQPVSDDVDVICSNDHPSTSGDSSSSAGPSKPQPVSDDVDVICSNDHPSTSGTLQKRHNEESSIPVKKRRTDDGDDSIIVN